MNRQVATFIKNTGFAVFANLCRIMTTLVLTLILPKVMSVEDYSSWQLYLFYATYFLYSSFGWCEGLYIEYGGMVYENLDKKKVSSQIWGIAFYEMILGFCLIFGVFPLLGTGENKLFLLTGAVIYMVFNVTRYQLQTVLQATYRIEDYARVYSGERLLFFCLILGCVLSGHVDYKLFIWMEITSNFLMLLYAAALCRTVIFVKPCGIQDSWRETRRLIRTGYTISLAGLTGQMIIGVVRFAIERRYGTVTFGKISLSFSMANMLVTCISAVSIVVFPVLKRLDRERAYGLFLPVRTIMTMPMFGVLLLYVPMNTALGIWLPQYRDSLKYLAILLPLCIYEVRNMALVWTYLKVWGAQRYILYANVSTLAVSIVSTLVTVYLLNSVDLAAASIMGLYAVKAVLTEMMLKKYVKTGDAADMFREAVLTIVFIFLSWTRSPLSAFLGYLLCYAAYMVMGRKKLSDAYRIMRGVIRGGQ